VGKHKGRTVVFIRERVEKSDLPYKEKILDQLSSEERATFASALTISWVPDTLVAAIINKAAKILYPGLSSGIREIGREQATADLGGLYSVLLAVTTVSFALSRTAQFWSTFNDEGTPKLTQVPGSSEAVLLVENYPGFPHELGEYNCGYIIGVLGRAGATGIRVTFEYQHGRNPKWAATWRWEWTGPSAPAATSFQVHDLLNPSRRERYGPGSCASVKRDTRSPQAGFFQRSPTTESTTQPAMVAMSNTGNPVARRIAAEKGGRSVHSRTMAPVSGWALVSVKATSTTSSFILPLSRSARGSLLILENSPVSWIPAIVQGISRVIPTLSR
jgi:hypothetical protein